MDITIGPSTLYALLSTSKQIEIPSFQRGYSWRRDNLEQFIEDIKTSAADNEPHFFGPLVLLRAGGLGDSYEIVDGQQRITTALMSLAILRDIAAEFESKSYQPATWIEINLLSELEQRIFTLTPANERQPIFLAAPAIRDVFMKFALDYPRDLHRITSHGANMTPKERQNSVNLRPAWLYLNEELKKLITADAKSEPEKKEKLHKLYVALTSNFEFHTMVLSSEQDAYYLFETLNDRGLRLAPADILRTMTLRQVKPDSPEFDATLSRWDNMLQNLNGYDISRFLRHYLVATTDKPVKRSMIVKDFRKKITENGGPGAIQTLKMLESASLNYSYLLGTYPSTNTQCDNSALRLNVLGDTHRIFTLGVLLQNTGLSDQDKQMLFRAAEYLHFRWTFLGLNAQNLENKYQSLLDTLNKRKSVHEVVETILSDSNIGDEKFPKTFEDDKFNGNPDHSKYILHRIEQLYGGDGMHWGSGRNPTLEHLAPKKPKASSNWYKFIAAAEPPTGESYSDCVDRWGNLTMLEFVLNSTIKNSDWIYKLHGPKDGTIARTIGSSTYNLNKPLKSIEQWDLSAINARTEWLRASMMELVSAKWVKTGDATVAEWKPIELQVE